MSKDQKLAVSRRTSTNKKSRKRKRDKPTFIETVRQKQLLEISLDLFRKQGIDNTSLAEIAKVAGVSNGVVSYHFESKKHLGEEVLRHLLRQYSHYLQDRLASKSNALDKLNEFLTATLAYSKQHREDYFVYMNTLGCYATQDERAEFIRWANDSLRNMLVDIIKTGQQRGEIARVPAKHLADLLQATTDGLMDLGLKSEDKVDIDACRKLFQRMLKPLTAP